MSKVPKISKRSAVTFSAPMLSVSIIILAGALGTFARTQESSSQTDSVADAARKARDRLANSTTRAKLITNADLGVPDQPPNAAASDVASASSAAAEASAPNAANSCDDAAAVKRIERKLQDAEQELAQLRVELSHQPPVISDNDLDLQYFRPGNVGFDVGSPPLLNSQPPAASRIAQVEVEKRIASLRRALSIVCEPPEVARIHIEIDDLERQLNLLRRLFALDQDSYYSKTNFKEDAAGRDRLAAEQLQIHGLQDQIERLNQELAVLNTSHY